MVNTQFRMLYNGLAKVIDLALRDLDPSVLHRYRSALVLGSLREDMWYVPGLRVVSLSTALSHFYGPGLPGGLIPFLSFGTPWMTERRYRKALAEFRAGRTASAIVQLGRAAHLLIDMGCPVHVHRMVHVSDPYEWFIEGNGERLASLPARPLPEGAHPRSAAELARSLARLTQRYPADRTASPWGRLLKRLGLLRTSTREAVSRQADDLVPATVAHTRELFRLFLANTR